MARLAPHLVLLRLLSHTLMAAKLEDDDSADLPAAETQPSPLLPAEQVWTRCRWEGRSCSRQTIMAAHKFLPPTPSCTR